ncbi:MAG: hypothetical protein ACETVQ_01030 [Candidatus Bathyarchaeia archaeon]
MTDDERKRILKDIEAQGFPLEVETSEVLEAHGWEVTNQFAYMDYEREKFRTVDILAKQNVLLEPLKLAFDAHLVIECKKSTNPWVFYATDFDLNKPETKRMAVSSMQFFINTLAYQRKSHERLQNLMINQLMLGNHLISPIFGKLAHIPFEPFTKGKGRSIHKARMQVCNAILDLRDKQFEETQSDFPYGIVFIPVIVLDGHLYAYEDGKLNAEEGLYYYVTYADSSFIIEIVTKDFLGTYLDLIEHQIKKFQTKFAKQKRSNAVSNTNL